MNLLTFHIRVPVVRAPPAVDRALYLLLVASLEPPIRAGESAVAGLGALVAAAAQPELAKALKLDKKSRVVVIVCEAAHEST